MADEQCWLKIMSRECVLVSKWLFMWLFFLLFFLEIPFQNQGVFKMVGRNVNFDSNLLQFGTFESLQQFITLIMKLSYWKCTCKKLILSLLFQVVNNSAIRVQVTHNEPTKYIFQCMMGNGTYICERQVFVGCK